MFQSACNRRLRSNRCKQQGVISSHNRKVGRGQAPSHLQLENFIRDLDPSVCPPSVLSKNFIHRFASPPACLQEQTQHLQEGGGLSLFSLCFRSQETFSRSSSNQTKATEACSSHVCFRFVVELIRCRKIVSLDHPREWLLGAYGSARQYENICVSADSL